MNKINFIIATLLFSISWHVYADTTIHKLTDSINVTRDTDSQLSELQTKVMNEATKLSFACRMFRDLYDRWPSNLEEVQSKTTGIDYAVFLDRAVVTPLSDDTQKIEVFDGQDMRTVIAVPVDFNLSEEELNAAQKPDFKIEF